MICPHATEPLPDRLGCTLCAIEGATCPICEGTGRIDLGGGEGAACDRCDATGVVDPEEEP